MHHNANKNDGQGLLDELRGGKKEKVLFARNFYRVPKLFGETQFDEDTEGQIFYLVDQKKGTPSLPVHPSSKTKLTGYSQQHTVQATNSQATGLLNRLANSFLFTSSFMYYNKYSQIVYEGSKVNLFGVAGYNPLSDSWEITNPLAFIKDGYVGEYIKQLKWDQVSSGLGFVIRGVILGLSLSIALWAGRRLLRRLRNRVMAIINERFQREDQDRQIDNAPPIKR